jgi:mannose-6-phosphate isomerase-like protein (cupin superfamily)
MDVDARARRSPIHLLLIPAGDMIDSEGRGVVMHAFKRSGYVVGIALAGVVTLAADSGLRAQGAPASLVSNPGLILQKDEGDRRVRRPVLGSKAALPSFIIKVDREYGKSSSFYMGMEDLAPGQGLRRHHHPHAEEILFIHRGSGTARLGDREAHVETGTTIWIPRDVSVELRNTGEEPLTFLYFFPEPDGMASYMRAGSVSEGQEPKPFTPEEFRRHVEKARAHIVFDGPQPWN